MIVSVAMIVAMFPMIVHADDQQFSFADLQAQLEASDGERVVLTENCTALNGESTITVPGGAEWMLDLNGKTINGNSNEIFVVSSGASLTLMNTAHDDDPTSTSFIANGQAANGGAIYVEEDGELFLCSGIEFVGNGAQNGGAIYCAGKVDIGSDVIIARNYKMGGKGTDIFVAEGGELILGGNANINNVYLSKDTVITLSGNCSNASVGVETEAVPTFSNPVIFAVDADNYGSTSIFTCESEYEIVKKDNVFLLATEIEEEEVVIPPSIKYCNMTLDGKIGLNVYIDLGTYTEDELSSSFMEFYVGNRELQIVEFDSSFTADINAKTFYGFRCDLSSLELGCNVECLLKNGEEALDQEEMSVSSYLAAITASPNGVEKAFVNFAHYMWEYLKSVHSDGENAWEYNYPQVSKVYDDDFLSLNYDAVITGCEENGIKAAVKDIENSDVTKVTFQLEFETTNAFMIYFYLDSESSYSANSIPVTVNGEKKRAYKVADNKYRIRINDIYLQDLDTEYIIESDCADVGDFTVTASPMSYVYTALCNSASSTAKKNAMASVYVLWGLVSGYNDALIGQGGR